jgi:hypothetical protein
MLPELNDAAAWTAIWTCALFVVTAMLVLGAFIAAKYAKKTWKVAQKELDIARRELDIARDGEKRREAVRVAAWLTPNDHESALLDVYVANMNPLPVFDVDVKVVAMIKEGADSALVPNVIWSKHLGTLPPRPPERIEYIDGTGHVKGSWDKYAEKYRTGGVVADWGDWKVWSGKGAEAGITTEISFRDTSGIYWEREIKGSLNEKTAAASMQRDVGTLRPDPPLLDKDGVRNGSF